MAQSKIWDDLGEVGGGLIYSKEWDLKIEKLLHEKTSIIEGEVRDRSEKLIPGALLTVTGNGVSKKVRVDQNGFFNVEVNLVLIKLIFQKI